jgi:hypothetical protein
MPATMGRKTHGQFSTPFRGADLRDADPVFSLGNIMLLLAGHDTGEAADTFIGIEKERAFAHVKTPYKLYTGFPVTGLLRIWGRRADHWIE